MKLIIALFLQVMVVGGLTNNILAPSYVAKHHAEKVRKFFLLFDVKFLLLGSIFTCCPS